MVTVTVTVMRVVTGIEIRCNYNTTRFGSSLHDYGLLTMTVRVACMKTLILGG